MAKESARTDRSGQRGGHISITLQAQEGHMTKIYLTDSDAEAIVDFVKDDEEFYKTNKQLRIKPGRNACRRGSPTVSNCLSKYARLGLNPKGLATTNSPSPSVARLQRKW